MFSYAHMETQVFMTAFNEEEVTKEIVAVLNAGCGTIYLGISENNETVGIDDVDGTIRKLGAIISKRIEPNPARLIQSSLRYIDNKTVIVITIEKGFQRIYAIKDYGFSPEGCPMRNEKTTVELSREEIRDRYMERSRKDDDIMLNTPSSYEEISFYTMEIELSGRGYHFDQLSFERSYHLRTKEGKYNQLAGLLSDNNDTDIIYEKFQGNTENSISERTDYGRTSIITAYRHIKDRLIAENICKTDTTTRPRIDTYLYDINVVDEALINALLMNDWTQSAPVISMFSDRLEIIYHERPEKNNNSVPENTGLIRVFRAIDIKGSSEHRTEKTVIHFNREVMENHNKRFDIA